VDIVDWKAINEENVHEYDDIDVFFAGDVVSNRQDIELTSAVI
jgi:hypothetical protein